MPVFPIEAPGRPDWASAYRPLIPNGDMQTIAGRYWPVRLDENRWPCESRYFQTEDDVQVLARIHRRGGRATVLAVHGLAACSEAPYMLTLAGRALEEGFDVVRLNVRNCGGTEHLCPTLYHSGLTIDLRRVVEQLAPEPLFLIGFSMGGNMALKLAGEWGDDAPPHVLGVCGVSVPIDLALCSKRLGASRNRVYETRFLRRFRAALERKRALMPDRFEAPDLRGADSIWDFDDRVTAPAFGFRGAAHYYQECSSAGFLSRIRLPTLLIEARDDPFVPFEAYQRAGLFDNERVSLLTAKHGGHVAFLARGRRRFWAQEQALRFFHARLGQGIRDKG